MWRLFNRYNKFVWNYTMKQNNFNSRKQVIVLCYYRSYMHWIIFTVLYISVVAYFLKLSNNKKKFNKYYFCHRRSCSNGTRHCAWSPSRLYNAHIRLNLSQIQVDAHNFTFRSLDIDIPADFGLAMLLISFKDIVHYTYDLVKVLHKVVSR